MTDTPSKFSFNDFLMFLSLLKARKMIANNLYPRSKENIELVKEDFYHAVRPVFLKFLPIVDKESVERTFSREEIFGMQEYGCLPRKWNIHHQKSVAWGGCNFNPIYAAEIKNIPLTKEQEKECERNVEHFNSYILRFQLTNFLENAQRKGKLTKAFYNLFNGVLIVLPRELHKRLEREFMDVQKVIPPTAEKDPNDTLPPRVQILYPIWDQFIYLGDSFGETNPNELHYKKGVRKPSKKGKMIFDIVEKNPDRDEKKGLRKEFHQAEKISKRKKNLLRQKAEMFDDFEYDD